MNVVIDNMDDASLPIYEVGDAGAITVVGCEVKTVQGESGRLAVELERVSPHALRRVADVLEQAEKKGVYLPAILFKSEPSSTVCGEATRQMNIGVIAPLVG